MVFLNISVFSQGNINTHRRNQFK